MNTEDKMNISIMGREFHVSCPDDEREELLLAVDYLEKKISDIKQEGKVAGSDGIVIIAALSITHELLILQASNGGFDFEEFRRRIGCMHEEIDRVLVEVEPDNKQDN